MSYIKHNVHLTEGQKVKLVRAYKRRAPITLRLKHDQLSGPYEVFLTNRQIVKINKSKRDGTGTDIKISGSQIREQTGGNLLTTLLTQGAKMIPYAGKALGSLASGALSGLGGLTVDKIFGSGLFSIPQDKVDKLVKYKSFLTEAQRRQILTALQTGGGIPMFRLTKTQNKQSGGFLGTLLASIGIPLIMKALTGSGLQVGPGPIRSSVGVYVPKPRTRMRTKGGLVDPMLVTPPFYGDWTGGGLQVGPGPIKSSVGVYVPNKRGKGKRTTLIARHYVNDCCRSGGGIRKKKPPKEESESKGWWVNTRTKQSIQKHPPTRSNIMRFTDRPLSSEDISDWVEYLGIRHFRGVFSRDNLPKKIHGKECGIINLDTKIGPGTHWVTYMNINGEFCEYFDSFGLDMPVAVRKYLQTSGKPLEHSGDEIQSRYSVLCGYWCLYYLRERQIGDTMLHVIHNRYFDMTDASVNHAFITNYFETLSQAFI